MQDNHEIVRHVGISKMRHQFMRCDTMEEAKKACPWATKIIQTDYGFSCFESAEEADEWNRIAATPD